MKILLLGIVCSALFCSCHSLAKPDNDDSITRSQTIDVPNALDGCRLTLSTQNATHYATGSTGMEIAIKTKFKNYKSRAWSPCEAKVELQYQDFTFTRDKWKSGDCSGPYKIEKIGKDKLFIIIDADEYICDCIYLLLDFRSNNSGVAVWGQEHSFNGNIQFELQSLARKQQSSNSQIDIEAPKSLEGSLIELSYYDDSKKLNTLYFTIQNGIAYTTAFDGVINVRPKLRKTGKDRYGVSCIDQSGRSWGECDRFSYKLNGNQGQLFLHYEGRHDYQLCYSAKMGEEYDYVYSNSPAIISFNKENSNVYEGTIQGVYGSPAMSMPPFTLSKIKIIK